MAPYFQDILIIYNSYFKIEIKSSEHFKCLVLLQVPKHVGLVQIFCAIPKTDLHIAPVPKILSWTKRWFTFSKFSFRVSTKFCKVALSTVSFLLWHKLSIWTSTKHFVTCERTRHKILVAWKNLYKTFTKPWLFFLLFFCRSHRGSFVWDEPIYR